MGMSMALAAMLLHVRMVRWQIGMGVRNLLGIVRGPEPSGQEETDEGHQAENSQSHGNADLAPEPSGQRVGQEPACVRERELRREESRAILSLG